jgi:hypothetical protein
LREKKNMISKSLRSIFAACAAVVLTSSPLYAEEAAPAEDTTRIMGVSLEAEVTAIDYKARELSLRGPQGNIITITAGDHIKRLEDISVGDSIVTTYVASLEGELRAPTEEELANPWEVVEGAGVADKSAAPGAIAGRQIRAVCTLEGMNRLLGTITVKDPRGKYHVIGDVEPEKMEGVVLGATLVLVYTEAMAITLEHNPAAK